MRDLGERLGGHRIRIDPRALHVRDEHFRPQRHAEARVDALLAFVDEREIASFDVVDAIDGARRRRHVAGFDDAPRRWRAGAAAGGTLAPTAGAALRISTTGILLDVREGALGPLHQLVDDLARLRHARIAIGGEMRRAGRQLAQPLEEELSGADARAATARRRAAR